MYGWNVVGKNFVRFESKTCNYKKKRSDVNFRTSHAVSYNVVCFSNTTYYRIENSYTKCDHIT
jgi:hypothetical protein